MDLNQAVAIDVETSGVDPFVHKVLAIAIAPLDKSKGFLKVYVKHQDIAWTTRAKEFFDGYKSEWLERAVDPSEAYQTIEKFLINRFKTPVTALGHNVGFDMMFMRQLSSLSGRESLPFISHRAVDTHSVLYFMSALALVPNEALSSDGAFDYFGINVADEDRHTALGDAVATRDLFQACLRYVVLELGSHTKGEAARKHEETRFETYTDRAGRFRFRLMSSNGEVVANSVGFASRQECLSAIKQVVRGCRAR